MIRGPFLMSNIERGTEEQMSKEQMKEVGIS